MNKFTVEKDWMSNSGYRCVVIMGSMGHRCGYVGIPSSHPLHGVDYSEEVPALEHKIEEVLKGTIGKRSPILVLIMAGKSGNEFARPDFMLDVRVAKEMHMGDEKGTILFAWPMTEDIAKAMDIKSKFTGLMIAMKPNSPDILDKFKSGEYTGFSIGGRRIVDRELDDG